MTLTSEEDALIARLHPTATIHLQHVDIARLTQLTPDDLIERFLKRDDYRIVAEEGNAEDLSQVEIDTEDDLVSEELAEIYLNQGLYDDAIDTYRKLSLLNSEKSIYFAELIARIEDKKNR
jgi:DNA-binding SARP family transcriptional activator